MPPPARKRPGIAVRGSCTEGHVTEGTSDPGRLTAEFTCSHDGCELPVKAKRIPKDAIAPPPAVDDAGGTRVIRIDDYAATATGAQHDDGGLVVADTTAAAGGTDPSESAGDDGTPDPLGEHGGRRGLSDWWGERKRRAAVRSARHGYAHPLGI